MAAAAAVERGAAWKGDREGEHLQRAAEGVVVEARLQPREVLVPHLLGEPLAKRASGSDATAGTPGASGGGASTSASVGEHDELRRQLQRP